MNKKDLCNIMSSGENLAMRIKIIIDIKFEKMKELISEIAGKLTAYEAMTLILSLIMIIIMLISLSR